MAEENGCFSLTFSSTKKEVGTAFLHMGVDAWIGSVMPLIQKGVSFETIKSLGAQGVYDMHRDAVADGQIYGPSPKYAGNFRGQFIGQNKPPMTVRINLLVSCNSFLALLQPSIITLVYKIYCR